MSAQTHRLNLARKYRPQQLSELMGQAGAVKLLTESIQKDQIAPAYLFSGPRGVGKTSTARIFARAASCLAEDSLLRPCGKCRFCLSLKEGQSLDMLEIDGASHTGVDDVRSLIDSAAYRPSFGKRKVFIVDEVHMLSQAAFNALLKTLEEPPPHVLFLFATTEADKIPSTILSRVQRLELRRLSEKLIFDNLKFISEKEKIQCDDLSLQQIASAADGSLRDAQTLLEQMVLLSGSAALNPQIVDSFLGSIGTDKEIQLFELIAQRKQKEILSQIKDFFEKGKDLRALTNRLVEWSRAIVLSKSTGDWSLLEDEWDSSYLQRLQRAFDGWSIEDTDRLFEILWTASEKLKRSDQGHIILEIALLRSCRMISSVDLSQIISKLDELVIEQASRPSISSLNISPARSTELPETAPKKTLARAAEKKSGPELSPPSLEKMKIDSPTQLLGLLKTHHPSLYSLAVSAQSSRLEDSFFVLEYPKTHFAYRQISDPMMQKEFQNFLDQISVDPMKLKIQEVLKGPAKQEPSKKNFIQAARHEILSDPDILNITQQLNGKVSEVTIEGIKT
jgi:DNA polymerase-3 subunit gamma/tau